MLETRNIITIPRKSNKVPFIQAENVSNKRHDINQKTFNNIKDIRNRNINININFPFFYDLQWLITYNLYGRHLVAAAPSQLPVRQITEWEPQGLPTCTRCSPHHLCWPPPSRAWPPRPPPPTYSHCHPHPHPAPQARGVNASVHRGQPNKIFTEVKLGPILHSDPSIR